MDPHYSTWRSGGDRIPDLVIGRAGEAVIVDAQVVGMRVVLEGYHAHKFAKYSDPDLLRLALGGHPVSPIVTSAIVSYRGIW